MNLRINAMVINDIAIFAIHYPILFAKIVIGTTITKKFGYVLTIGNSIK